METKRVEQWTSNMPNVITLYCTWHQDNSYPFIAKTSAEQPLKILLCQGPRALTHYCTCVHAGRPTTARMYLTKHKNRKFVDGTKRYGSVN
jgi:hypothetical protein